MQHIQIFSRETFDPHQSRGYIDEFLIEQNENIKGQFFTSENLLINCQVNEIVYKYCLTTCKVQWGYFATIPNYKATKDQQKIMQLLINIPCEMKTSCLQRFFCLF